MKNVSKFDDYILVRDLKNLKQQSVAENLQIVFNDFHIEYAINYIYDFFKMDLIHIGIQFLFENHIHDRNHLFAELLL